MAFITSDPTTIYRHALNAWVSPLATCALPKGVCYLLTYAYAVRAALVPGPSVCPCAPACPVCVPCVSRPPGSPGVFLPGIGYRTRYRHPIDVLHHIAKWRSYLKCYSAPWRCSRKTSSKKHRVPLEHCAIPCRWRVTCVPDAAGRNPRAFAQHCHLSPWRRRPECSCSSIRPKRSVL